MLVSWSNKLLHLRSSGNTHGYGHSMYVLASSGFSLSPLVTSLALVQEPGSLVSLSDRLQLLLSVQCQTQCCFDSADLLSAVRGLAMHITFCRASRDQTAGIYFSIWQLPVALRFKLSIWSCFMPRNKMQWLSRNGNRFPLRLWVNIYDVFVLPIKTLFVCVCFLSTVLFLRRTTEQQQRFHEICGNLVKTQRRVLGWWKRLFALKEEKPKMVCSSTFLVFLSLNSLVTHKHFTLKPSCHFTALSWLYHCCSAGRTNKHEPSPSAQLYLYMIKRHSSP